MLSNPEGNLQLLVTKMLAGDKHKEALSSADEKYQIRQYKIQNLYPHQVFLMHYVMAQKFYTSESRNVQTWYENELRLFIWILVCYFFQQRRCVSEITNDDLQFLKDIFKNKSLDTIEYQALSILKRNAKFTRWTPRENSILQELTKEKSGKKKWNNIAKQLYILSQKKYYRTGKQCREYFNNHLNPETIKKNWTSQEDLIIIKSIRDNGKKWALVSKKLDGKRTEHMVKNRYKSLYQNQQRRCLNQYHRLLDEQQILMEIETRLKHEIENQKYKQGLQKQYNLQEKADGNDKFQSAGESVKDLDDGSRDSFCLDSGVQLESLLSYSPKLNCMYKTYNSITCSPLSLEDQHDLINKVTQNYLDDQSIIYQRLNCNFN